MKWEEGREEPIKKATIRKLPTLKIRLAGINQVQVDAIIPARTLVMITSAKNVRTPN